MGKQGPCYHCGVTSTPLWRNGPPGKPVLCNACGSRWRTKGTLANYTPLHARAEVIGLEDYRNTGELKPISIKIKEPKLQKRKHLNDNTETGGEALNTEQNYQNFSEDTSNRSSSGSGVSYSASCVHFDSKDACDLTGLTQSTIWDSAVPSRKRTCLDRPKPSPVEKLTRDLYCILHEQQSLHLSGSLEEDLVFESGTWMDSDEIGLGGILIKNPNAVIQAEESVASSLPVEENISNINDTYSGPSSLHVRILNKEESPPNIACDKTKKFSRQAEKVQTDRAMLSSVKFHVLQDKNSPLTDVDLIASSCIVEQDVVCFENFVRSFTSEEQQNLMKFLPSVDTSKLPDSLRSMFDSPQFIEALSSFQHLLVEGIFDLTFSGLKTEEHRALERLALDNMNKSQWVEHYAPLKVENFRATNETGCKTWVKAHGCSSSASIKRIHDSQNQRFTEPKSQVRVPDCVRNCGTKNTSLLFQPNAIDRSITSSDTTAKYIDKGESCISQECHLTIPTDECSAMLDSSDLTDDNFNQNFLFDMPSYASSPLAQLLDC